MDSATNITSVSKGLSETGLASGLSGIVSEVSSVTNGFLGLLSPGKGLLRADFQLPIENVLHNYATYNYIFSLGCLDANSYNHPETSYIVGKHPPWVCKSAGGDPNNRIKLANVGKYDFFIEDLEIDAYTTFTERAGNTNNTNLSFSVIEPYSMGMFMVALQTAAYNQGYSTWSDAVFLLMIEFKGNLESGQMMSIPKTTKYIPIQFTNTIMKTDSSGTKWSMTARAASSFAFNDSNKKIKSDITITGKTVQEILQSGGKSLQQVINARLKEAAKLGTVSVPDEILILFPENISTINATNKSESTNNQSNSATKNPTKQTDAELFKKLGVTRSSSSALIQQPLGCNGIGKATLGFGGSRYGYKPFSNDDAVYDEIGKIVKQIKVTPKPGEVDFKFNQNSDIINAINQVILKSNIAIEALSPEQITPTGMRPWFRVDPMVYHISSNANLKTTGTTPKLIVYRVIPYMAHASKLLPPNVPTPGLVELKKEVVKEYNYIYTGKNIDILNFEFEMTQSFYNEMSADNFTKNGDIITNNQRSIIENKQNNNSAFIIPSGDGNLAYNAMNATTKFINTLASMDNKGGSAGDTAATRAAKLFHDAVINSKDLQEINLQIIGDPYYICGSGCGNYTDTQLDLSNITKDGSMNYQNGEIHIIINFRTPTDINQTTGLYDIKNSELCQQFSGVFKLLNVKSTFMHGEFKQVLNATRIQGQDSTVPQGAVNSSSLLSTTFGPIINKGLGEFTTTGTAKSIGDFLGSSFTNI